MVGILLGYLASALWVGETGGWRNMYGVAVFPALILAAGMVSATPASPCCAVLRPAMLCFAHLHLAMLCCALLCFAVLETGKTMLCCACCAMLEAGRTCVKLSCSQLPCLRLADCYSLCPGLCCALSRCAVPCSALLSTGEIGAGGTHLKLSSFQTSFCQSMLLTLCHALPCFVILCDTLPYFAVLFATRIVVWQT